MSWDFLYTPEFWMTAAAVAALLPGPQTKVLGAIFRAVAGQLKGKRR